MKRTLKKTISLILVFAVMVSAAVFVSAAGAYVTGTTALTIDASSSDPTAKINVSVNDFECNTVYRINWLYESSSSRVVDIDSSPQKSQTSDALTWTITVTAVQKGTCTIPFVVTEKETGIEVGTVNCEITVTAPTLTVTPSDVVIDLNESSSATVEAVVSDFSDINAIDIGVATSSGISYEFGNEITNGTQIIINATSAGTYSLYVKLRNQKTGYDILSQRYTVTVKPKNVVTLSSISINTNPDKMVYEIGEAFDSSGLTLKATYSDGSSEIISSGFTCSSVNTSAAGSKRVTVTYGGKTAALNITVKNPVTVSAVAVNSLPGKTVYLVGESFSPEGLALKVTYSDGTSQIVSSGFECSKPDMSAAGVKKVTVKYSGKTTDFEINVVNPQPSTPGKALSVNLLIESEFDGVDTTVLTAKLNPSDAEYESISWSSSNSRIATVDGNGVVTSYGVAGTAIITVTVVNEDGSVVSDTLRLTFEGTEEEEEEKEEETNKDDDKEEEGNDTGAVNKKPVLGIREFFVTVFQVILYLILAVINSL
ncbi:MAG: bacterial Ig-like domain-containing protein [Clostridia bacterium]|nr:bacterial Ig-like domain-containing protein [Clostridia bacterium]